MHETNYGESFRLSHSTEKLILKPGKNKFSKNKDVCSEIDSVIISEKIYSEVECGKF